MAVVSIKVDELIKKEMIKYKEKVNWPEIIREFITENIEKIKREENLLHVERILEEINDTEDKRKG